MGVQFTWEPKLSVGHEELDRQHRRLIQLANSLSWALGPDELRLLVLRLLGHVREHFGLEEQVMERAGYPGLAAHARLHSELLATLSDLDPASLDTEEGLQRFRRFVYEWVVDHLMEHDRDYARFLERQGRAP